MNFAVIEHVVRNGLWEEAEQYTAEHVGRLEKGGADVVICVSNTLHRVAPAFTAGLSIPFLHIADPTAAAIQKAGFRRVALLGTKPVMSQDFLKNRYQDKFGLEIMIPSDEEQTAVDRIIFDELCRGEILSSSKAVYLDIVDRLHERGAQGVILGCTEIPLLISQADRPEIPFFDTLALHVDAVVTWALTD